VADTGIGIPADALPHLFERFSRVDKARSRQMGGAGLGLAIVKSIVIAHGGQVTVESTEGRGSRFCVLLFKQEVLEK
jgi:signal transduction histidine kinase